MTGLCSAFLLSEASEKHQQRVAPAAGPAGPGGPGSAAQLSSATESANEEREADLLLQGLESQLGYDFSMPEL